jgi:hypothetical protein
MTAPLTQLEEALQASEVRSGGVGTVIIRVYHLGYCSRGVTSVNKSFIRTRFGSILI